MHMHASSTRTDAQWRDREVIRVGFPCDTLGIAAALRHAFAEAANDRSDHDFEELLRELR